jgi:O-antigen/teichoic acid export membrane protein
MKIPAGENELLAASDASSGPHSSRLRLPGQERAHAPTGGRSSFAGTVLAQFAILVFGIITGFASGRLLGPQGRGELAAVTLWPLAFVFLTSLGINQAIVYHSGRKRYSPSEIWSAALVLGILESLIVVVAGIALTPRVLAHYSPTVQHLGMMFFFASPLLFLGGLPGNLLQGQGDLRRFNLLRLIAPGFFAAGLIALLLRGDHRLEAALEAQVIGYGAAFVLGTWMVYRQVKPEFQWSPSVARDLLSYGIKTHLTNLTSYFNQRVDQLILSLLIPAEELGLYAVAVTLSMAVAFFPFAVGINTFSLGSNQSHTAARRTIASSFRASLMWLLLVSVGLYVAAPLLIATVLGPRFSGSVLACRLLLPGVVALGLNQVLYGGANALGRPLLPTCAEGAGLAATGIGLAFFVPRYGYLGAAGVSTVAYTVSLIVMLFLSASRLQLGLRELLFRPAAFGVKPTEVFEA